MKKEEQSSKPSRKDGGVADVNTKPATNNKKGDQTNDTPSNPKGTQTHGKRNNKPAEAANPSSRSGNGSIPEGKKVVDTCSKPDRKEGAPQAQKPKDEQTASSKEAKGQQRTHVRPDQVATAKLVVNREKMSWVNTSKLARRDADLLSTEPESFVRANARLYYIATNSWLHMIDDCSHDERLGLTFIDALNHDGLVETIHQCQIIAEHCINSFNASGKSVTMPLEVVASPIFNALKLVELDDDQLLQILRFLKRFSPDKADKLIDKALEAFYEINRGCKPTNGWRDVKPGLRVYQPDSCEYLEEQIRYHLAEMFSGYSSTNQYDDDLMQFSDGASQRGALLVEKINGYAEFQQHWKGYQYPLINVKDPFYWASQPDAEKGTKKLSNFLSTPIKIVRRYTPEEFVKTLTFKTMAQRDRDILAEDFSEAEYIEVTTEASTLYENYYVSPSAVAKSYKTARIIAVEHPYHAAHMQSVRRKLVKTLAKSRYHKFFDPQDQEENEELCRLGSIEPGYSTRDLSSASDCISWRLMQSVFPADVVADITPHRARYFAPAHLKKSKRWLTPSEGLVVSYIALTSGNPATFVCLGGIITAIYHTAYDMYSRYNPDEELLPFSVFGDDGCIDYRVATLADEIFERLGFKVNQEKSYSIESHYRESCGAEAMLGYDLRTSYFPRKNLKFNPCNDSANVVRMNDYYASLQSLISLQRELYVKYWSTQRFLADTLRALEPQKTWTTSVPGQCDTDLLSEIDTSLKSYWTIPNKASGKLCINKLGKIISRPITVGERLAQYNKANPCDQITYQIDGDNVTILACRRNSSIGTSTRKVEQRDPNVDMFLYVEWLQNGPRYEDRLMELLGISSKPRNYASAMRTIPLSVGYIKTK